MRRLGTQSQPDVPGRGGRRCWSVVGDPGSRQHPLLVRFCRLARLRVGLAVAGLPGMSFPGCGTIHPRLAPDLEVGAAGMERVALLCPNIDVRMKYYNTDVYVFSPAESNRVSHLFAEQVKQVFHEKGYDVTVLCAETGRDWRKAPAWHREPLRAGAEVPEPDVPEGVTRNSKASGDTLYEKRIQRAEQLFLEVITMDPSYENRSVPENLRFEAPSGDLSSYDLVVVVYGAMREETEPEHVSRWVKNLTVNAAMVPVSMASIIFPFTLPIAI